MLWVPVADGTLEAYSSPEGDWLTPWDAEWQVADAEEPVPTVIEETADPQTITITLTPAPNGATVSDLSPMVVEGIIECPSYTYSDLSAGALPVPEGYVESYLLPLARYEITRSHLFSRTELIPRFEADAQGALAALGVTDMAAAETGDVGTETATGRAAMAKRKASQA